jgi:hypothetical protein
MRATFLFAVAVDVDKLSEIFEDRVSNLFFNQVH